MAKHTACRWLPGLRAGCVPRSCSRALATTSVSGGPRQWLPGALGLKVHRDSCALYRLLGEWWPQPAPLLPLCCPTLSLSLGLLRLSLTPERSGRDPEAGVLRVSAGAFSQNSHQRLETHKLPLHPEL